ncbi:MAG: Chromatin structure remodeling complex protein sfh1 [Vezdaea aestivalis]|nr:MAG: Chromatin structure remodeling complex protein sfh1 [Vezdaea aestivalis]
MATLGTQTQAANMADREFPHAFMSAFAPRLRQHGNSLIAPVIAPAAMQPPPPSRTTKRGTTILSYAEEFEDDDDLDDGEGRRRPTGLRSLRREDPVQEKLSAAERASREVKAPVHVQAIWREWLGHAKTGKIDIQLVAQSQLPYVPIPIRIDLDIPAFTPSRPFPLPPNSRDVDINHLAYRIPEATPLMRIKDIFLWNLYEAVYTPEQVAITFVNEMDLPNKESLVLNISNQIRTQLEEQAPVATHQLFQLAPPNPSKPPPHLNGNAAHSTASTPAPDSALPTPRPTSAPPVLPPADPNPDEAYNCVISLSVNLGSLLYTDRFEWNLLHPSSEISSFVRLTCADLALRGEWALAITHAIHEAILRHKKDAIETGLLPGSTSINGTTLSSGIEIHNLAAEGRSAGIRYDPEHLAEEWGPKIEMLSKEEIEKREYDRERQIRRMKREQARFSTALPFAFASPFTPVQQQAGGYFDGLETGGETLGRGERKKRRRLRSISPPGRGGTPGGRGTPDVGGKQEGGGSGSLTEWYVFPFSFSNLFTSTLSCTMDDHED